MLGSYRLVVSIAVGMLLAVAPLAAQGESDARALVDQCDKLFVGIKRSKESIPQGTLQNWVRMQRACELLGMITVDRTLPLELRLKARYVLAFGYDVLELHDLAAAHDAAVVNEALADGSVDGGIISESCDDYAAALEAMGDFKGAVQARRKAIEIVGTPSLSMTNNLAFVLLKAGEYEECLKYVGMIDLEEETAHTRIFSARAHAYLGQFDEARADLAKACDLKESYACDIAAALAAAADAKTFWTADRANRARVWGPQGQIDPSWSHTAVSVPAVHDSIFGVSHFAPTYWFNEIFLMYDEARHGALRYPVKLPHGRLGIATVSGVPFLLLTTDRGDSATLDSVRAYLGDMHGPSAWDKEMPLRNRALAMPAPGGAGTVVAFVHTEALEQVIRKNIPGAWRVL